MVIATAGKSHSLVTHFLAGSRVHGRRGGLFDNFLVSALDRTLTLGQPHIVAVQVAKNLVFNVSRCLNIFLDKDTAITERTDGFVF